MSKANGSVVYALKAYSIKQYDGKYFIAPTASFDDKQRWSKPYATLQRACTAIARKLADEWMQRHKRRTAFYGVREDA